MTTFHVDSEVGPLRRVLLHRPGPSCDGSPRPTATSCSSTTSRGCKRARQEHDAFAEVLADRGVEVLLVGDLLTETMNGPAGPDLAASTGWSTSGTSAGTWPRRRGRPSRTPTPRPSPTHLIGGITVDELPHGSTRGLRADVLGPKGFVLPPLPNQLFTRDATAWIYDGVSLNPMALRARRRETTHLEAVYRFHPRFTAEPLPPLVRRRSTRTTAPEPSRGATSWSSATAPCSWGWAQRTTPQAVEALARRLFAADDGIDTVIAVVPAPQPGLHAPRHGHDDGRRGHLRDLPRGARRPAGPGPSHRATPTARSS